MATSPTPTIDDPRWQQVVAREAAADGAFWYSVVTTGVYCRPSCPSRAALPENVTLHATLAEAQATGFRPCLRCRPDQPSRTAELTDLVSTACRTIEKAPTPPSLAALAGQAGLSPGHFHRLFKRVTGLTPKAFASERRAHLLREELVAGGSVTEALYTAGFGSSSRLYEGAGSMLGMTPGRFRRGGEQEVIRFAVADCSLGSVLVGSSATGVVAILIGDDPGSLARELQGRFPRAELIGGDDAYGERIGQVVAAIDQPRLALDLPLDIRGTAFQRRVWDALRAIPAGRTATYAEVADAIGAPAAVRAVAGACAANNIAVAIPCHRVVRTGGALSGYAWGVERKRALLNREAAD